MDIREFFMRGDIKGAIEYMRAHDEYKSILPYYVSLYEECRYLDYDVPENLNAILRLYQIYYRDIFYCSMDEKSASAMLVKGLNSLLGTDEDEEGLGKKLKDIFEKEGYHALFGRTQGYFGPYIWKETVAVSYSVELPFCTSEYKVNMLKGFVFRSWMDYLTFGKFGTGGWASPDGTINCIEKAYDTNSEKFLVSLLKHEAQHTEDMKAYPGITTTELEYRAKLVELIYSSSPTLLEKFISEADNSRVEDSHSMASWRIKENYKGAEKDDVSSIQKRARELFVDSTKEMEEKYLG